MTGQDPSGGGPNTALELKGNLRAGGAKGGPPGEKVDTNLLSLREKASCGAVEKVGYLRLVKNIQMRGLRRLQERGVLMRTPQGRESSITQQMGILVPCLVKLVFFLGLFDAFVRWICVSPPEVFLDLSS